MLLTILYEIVYLKNAFVIFVVQVHLQSVDQSSLMEAGFQLHLFCINPEKDQTELDNFNQAALVVRSCCFYSFFFLPCSIFFSMQVISPPLFVLSYLSMPTAAAFFIQSG